jgi:branched-chain amino acid transport system substrate-binding protein
MEDSGGDAAKGLADVKDLVQNKGVLALIPDDPSIDNAIVSYTTQQGIATIEAYAAYPIWNTTVGWFALGIPSFPTSIKADAQIMKGAGANSVAAIVCAEVAACGTFGVALQPAATANGIRYDGTLKLAEATPDYTAECLALKGKNTEVTAMGVDAVVADKFQANCAAQGFNPKLFFPYHAFQPLLTKIPNLQALAVEPTVPWYANIPAMATFRSAMGTNLDKADETSMFLWTSLEAFRAAASSLGSTPATKQSIRDAMFHLKNFDAGGLTPPQSFSPGQPSPAIQCYYVGGYSNGQFTLPQGSAMKCLS